MVFETTGAAREPAWAVPAAVFVRKAVEAQSAFPDELVSLIHIKTSEGGTTYELMRLVAGNTLDGSAWPG